MSTQQDIYAAGSENRPPMLNKENYVPWSSRLLRYAKSRPNGKLIYNSIMNGPYVRRMIPEPGDADREVPVPETFHEQTDDELTVAEIKQMEADDQACYHDSPLKHKIRRLGTIVVCMNWINFPPIHAACLEKLQPSFKPELHATPMPKPKTLQIPTPK
ncbi:hypothetical protein Tco_0459765 [Tanacetum coccineum]